jgi:hypothetical protein
MTTAFKVLRYELFSDDGSGRRLIQFALPGREFETAEALEAEGLIKREFMHGEWTATKMLAPRDTRVMETRAVCTTTREPFEFLTAADLRERYHCSRIWIVRHIQHHKFPEPIKFVAGAGISSMWLERQIQKYHFPDGQVADTGRSGPVCRSCSRTLSHACCVFPRGVDRGLCSLCGIRGLPEAYQIQSKQKRSAVPRRRRPRASACAAVMSNRKSQREHLDLQSRNLSETASVNGARARRATIATIRSCVAPGFLISPNGFKAFAVILNLKSVSK